MKSVFMPSKPNAQKVMVFGAEYINSAYDPKSAGANHAMADLVPEYEDENPPLVGDMTEDDFEIFADVAESAYFDRAINDLAESISKAPYPVYDSSGSLINPTDMEDVYGNASIRCSQGVRKSLDELIAHADHDPELAVAVSTFNEEFDGEDFGSRFYDAYISRGPGFRASRSAKFTPAMAQKLDEWAAQKSVEHGSITAPQWDRDMVYGTTTPLLNNMDQILSFDQDYRRSGWDMPGKDIKVFKLDGRERGYKPATIDVANAIVKRINNGEVTVRIQTAPSTTGPQGSHNHMIVFQTPVSTENIPFFTMPNESDFSLADALSAIQSETETVTYSTVTDYDLTPLQWEAAKLRLSETNHAIRRITQGWGLL